DFSRKPHWRGTWPNDVSHHRCFDGELFGGTKLWIVRKPCHGLIERPAQVKEDASAGGAVVSPAAQRLKQCIARKLRHKIAGKSADSAKARRTRSGGARPSFMIVAMTHHTDPVALFKCIVQKPFERPPRRMHLDRTFKPAVMCVVEIRIAPAHM